MNWDQIEVKWAEMARRVRNDLPRFAQNTTDEAARVQPSGELKAMAKTDKAAAL